MGFGERQLIKGMACYMNDNMGLIRVRLTTFDSEVKLSQTWKQPEFEGNEFVLETRSPSKTDLGNNILQSNRLVDS